MAVVREVIEESGGLEEDDVYDTCKEFDKSLYEGNCCTGFQYVKNR